MKKLALALLCAFAPLAQAQHQVTLNWQASPATFAVGYNIYRCSGTCAAGASGWTKVVGLTSAVSYTDTNVAAGSTYSYYVTAQDVSFANTESVPSNIYTGTIPTSGGSGSGQTPPPGTLSGSVQ